MTGSSMQRTFKFSSTAAMILLGSCLSILSPTAIAQNEELQKEFQQALQEERSWAGLRSKTLKVGEVTWSYSEGGPVDKPTLLLLHGLSGSRDNWNRLAHYLTPHYHVVIPDLPTGGETRTPADFDMSVPHITEQLRRFVEAANIPNQVHLAGHSLGGAIAMLYAAQYPFETQSLFLVSSGGVFRNAKTPYLHNPAYLKQLVVSKPGDFNYLLKTVMQNPPFLPRRYKQAQEQIMIAQAPQTAKMVDQLVALNRTYTPQSFALLARTIDAPSLIIWGKQDRIINVEVAEELKTLLKHAEPPVILDQVGHMPIMEAEQLVIQHYLPFLAKTQNLKKSLNTQPTQP